MSCPKFRSRILTQTLSKRISFNLTSSFIHYLSTSTDVNVFTSLTVLVSCSVSIPSSYSLSSSATTPRCTPSVCHSCRCLSGSLGLRFSLEPSRRPLFHRTSYRKPPEKTLCRSPFVSLPIYSPSLRPSSLGVMKWCKSLLFFFTSLRFNIFPP